MIIQLKAVETYFHIMVLFITSVDEIRTKAFKQYCHVALFYYAKQAGSLKSVDETLGFKHSNEKYRAVLSCHVVVFKFPRLPK